MISARSLYGKAGDSSGVTWRRVEGSVAYIAQIYASLAAPTVDLQPGLTNKPGYRQSIAAQQACARAGLSPSRPPDHFRKPGPARP
ncbi:unnamed protein product [Caenorhabditis auriculariae]|uniref:Uncharacterized protein n=1 Tax=Caenorhabditis auriculariae TaxID=2777116 RepID=A0A8S1HM62_9PELO|nr:unnamed protein product [Caenorhabditis auriculariae]